MKIRVKRICKNRRIPVLLPVFLLLFTAGIRLWTPSDPLKELKEEEKTELPPDAEKTVRQVLNCIEKEDMKSLFKLMVYQDGDLFQGVYVKGLFAGTPVTEP